MKKVLFLLLPAFVLLFQAARADIVLDSLWEKNISPMYVEQIKFSPDGNYIALAQYNTHKEQDTTHVNPVLLNTKNGQLVREFSGGHRASIITTASFSPDGSLLATGDHPLDSIRTICIWNVQTGQLVRKLLQNDTAVKNYTDVLYSEFTKDGRYLVCILYSKLKYFDEEYKMRSYENLLLFIDTQTWQIARVSDIHPYGDRYFKLSPSGSYYAYIDGEMSIDSIITQHVYIRNINNDSLVKEFTHTGESGYLAYSPDGSMLAEIMYDSLRLYDLNTMMVLKDLPVLPSTYRDLKISPNNQYLILSRSLAPIDSLLIIMDVNTGQTVAAENISGHLDYDPDFKNILIGVGNRIRLDSIIYSPMAVPDNNPKGKINVVYPNPTDGSINIKINEVNTEEMKFEIFGSNGNKVSDVSPADIQIGSDNIIHYNANNLSSGVYFFRISGPGNTETYKIIKK